MKNKIDTRPFTEIIIFWTTVIRRLYYLLAWLISRDITAVYVMVHVRWRLGSYWRMPFGLRVRQVEREDFTANLPAASRR